MIENRKRGRPAVLEGEQKARSVKLTDNNVVIAKKIGGGNMTKGIRKALEAYNASERY